ncbi:hypothetical protein MKW98_018965 [Papaver atlanticum]|uniref:Uncharacterized protein n=1 Tax=Papaver atlanticum TaxID=357466 RepID=A0AAD4TG14_9MAGN|nr:hypothetical protein MKW98_018965 [Papaver atlanticum]
MRRYIPRRRSGRVVNRPIKGDEPKQKWKWKWRYRRTVLIVKSSGFWKHPAEGNAHEHPEEKGQKSSKQPKKRKRAKKKVPVEVEETGPEQTQEGEVWFRVEGKDLCFCKTDFKEVTGLPFKDSGEENELKGVSNLKKKHFVGFKKVERINLYDFLVFRTKPMVQGAGADALRNPILSGMDACALPAFA